MLCDDSTKIEEKVKKACLPDTVQIQNIRHQAE